jgi:hypothetical protein
MSDDKITAPTEAEIRAASPTASGFGAIVKMMPAVDHNAEIARLRTELEESRASEEGAHMIIATERAEVVQLRRRVAELDAQVADMTQQRDAALAGAVKAKPLVWAETSADTFLADSQFGLYSRWEGHYRPAGAYGGGIASPDPVAAAQADYEARIRAALQPDPDARQADLAKAWTMGRDAAAGEAHGFWIDSDDRTVELSDYIRALTPPADLAAKIGGE